MFFYNTEHVCAEYFFSYNALIFQPMCIKYNGLAPLILLSICNPANFFSFVYFIMTNRAMKMCVCVE